MTQNNFRHDVNGLRSIAVISVLFYHAGLEIFNFNFLTGGFLGVDIFFVISGFLITRILVKNFKENTFSFLQFYERRIRRIFPSLFLLLTLVGFFSIFIMSEKQYLENSSATLSALFFISNFFFLLQDSYTSVESQFKPLIHTWSLGVEEQFYLFFPFIIFLLLKLNQNLKIYLSILIILSLLSCFLLANFFPEKNFFFSPSRFWELFFGSLIYLIGNYDLVKNHENETEKEKYTKFGSVFLWILLIFFLFYFNNKDNHPGLPNLIVVGITGLIIFLKQDNFNILRNRIIKFFADISFTLYLFHLPIFSFSRIKFGELSNLQEIGLLIVSIIISGIVFYTYENKVKNIKSNKLFILLLSFFLILTFFSIKSIHTNNKTKKIKLNDITYVLKDEKELRWQYLKKTCEKVGWESCYRPQKDKKNFLVIGDSMSPDAGNMINAMYQNSIGDDSNFYIITDSLGGCQPHPDFENIAPNNHPGLKNCVKKNKERFTKEYYEGVDVIFINNNYSWFKPEDLIPYIDFLQSIGKNKIVLVGSYIHLNKDFSEILREKKIKSTVNLNNEIFNDNLASILNFDEKLEIISNKKGLHYISFKKLCPNGNCIFFTDKGYPFTWDMFHLSKQFVEYFVKNYFEEEKLKLYLSN